MKALTTEEFISRAEKVYQNKYSYEKTNYINSDLKIIITCSIHGDFEKRPLKFLSGRECIGCKTKRTNTKKLTTEEFISRSKEIFGDKFDYSKVEYKNNRTRVILGCEIHGDFETIPNYHLSDKTCCQQCAKDIIIQKNTMTQDDFLIKSKEVHGNKYDYSKTIYKHINQKIIIKCLEHGEFKQAPLHHIHNKSGCPKCGYMITKTKMTNENFIKRSTKMHQNKYNYSLVNIKGSSYKIDIICEKHGVFNQLPIAHINGQGCPSCNSSKGEMKVRNYLIDNNIDFEVQKKFNECKNIRCLPFDFYLPKFNTCIEFNGTQHYKMSTFFGQDSFDKLIINDKIKNEFCKKNNINLLTIKYNENIDNILNGFIN